MLALIATLKNKEAEWLTLKHWAIAKEVYKSFWESKSFSDEQYLKRLRRAILRKKVNYNLT